MYQPDYALQIPMGLNAALMKNPTAFEWFSGLSAPAQQAIIERTHSIRSKEEMNAFVSQFGTEQSSTLF